MAEQAACSAADLAAQQGPIAWRPVHSTMGPLLWCVCSGRMFPKPCHHCYDCGRWPLCGRCHDDHPCATGGGKRPYANDEEDMNDEELQVHKRLRDTHEFRLPWSEETRPLPTPPMPEV